MGERWASFTRTAPCVCRGLKTWASFVDAAEETLGQGSEGRFLNDRRDCRGVATPSRRRDFLNTFSRKRARRSHSEPQKRPETSENLLDPRSWNPDFQEKLATPLVVTPLALPDPRGRSLP